MEEDQDVPFTVSWSGRPPPTGADADHPRRLGAGGGYVPGRLRVIGVGMEPGGCLAIRALGGPGRAFKARGGGRLRPGSLLGPAPPNQAVSWAACG